MEKNQFLGLVKFFRNEDYLDSLISGTFHCTPPEVYRLDKQEGVSDKSESCAFSYRKDRGDDPIKVTFAGKVIGKITGATIHNPQSKDSWLHCWFILRLPTDDDALKNLTSDIFKMKEQFGAHYAFIPASNLNPLISEIKKLSSKDLYSGEVEYSDNPEKWGNLHKSKNYSYQREYRFLFGECKSSEQESYVFRNIHGFSHLILKNTDFQLLNMDTKHVWFDLRT